MRLAFYAPMKPPDHPVPSGDRSIAQSLIAALEYAGASVDLASRLQTRDGRGQDVRQKEIMEAAKTEVRRLISEGRGRAWDGWITYHNYYKAPDLIGPQVAATLNIPYLQIESTRAKKRLTGPWAEFARSAEKATDSASVVFYFSKRDGETLKRDMVLDQQLIHLRPFLNRAEIAYGSVCNGPILSVGMMRHGDKLASYEIIAQSLALLPQDGWQLEIAGDGPARSEVEALMQPFGANVQFLGQLDHDGINLAYDRAGLFFWPGVNEALGMVYLEAQAAGLPVVAQDRPGMQEVLAPNTYPSVDEGAQGLAKMLELYLQDQTLRHAKGAAARSFVADHHLLPQAAQTLREGLAKAGLSL